MEIQFDTQTLEKKFKEAEDVLLNLDNVTIVKYKDFNHETFDDHNQELLKVIAQKPIVYCIWTGVSEKEMQYKYIGHVGKKYSRQRLRNHLTKKHERTGAQLKNTIKALSEKNIVGISFILTKPHYMRKALEDWLIDKHSERLDWNISGRRTTIKN